MEQSFFKRTLALLLCLVMAFSTVSTGLATEVQPEDIIHYVSLGDSMTNGYCFTGYGQGRNYGMTPDKFSEGTSVYGDDAYPNLFAEWLASKTDMTVDHKKLAVSAMRAEDLYYILGGRDMPTDGWFDQTEYYSNTDDEALKGIYQDAISNADIISMSIGNASFGAYLVQYFTSLVGVLGASLNQNEYVDLEKAISILPEEKQTAIMEVYNKILTAAESYIPENIGGLIDTQKLIDMMAYISVGFLFNYEGVLDKIVELNPDVEIILIGLMNTTYGLRVVGDGMEPIPFGDIVGSIFDVLNAYIAGLPAVKQMKGEWPDAKFYYADTPDPEFIVQEFKTMAENDWEDDGEGLSEDVVRSRTIEAYNEMLCPMIGGPLGFNLPVLELGDVANYEFIGGDADPYTVPTQYAAQAGEYGAALMSGSSPDLEDYLLVKRFLEEGNSVADLGDEDKVAACFKGDIEKEISVAIYLALEDALVTSVDNMDITLDGLMGIATDIMGTLGDFPEELSPDQNPGPKTIHDELYEWFTGNPTSLGMCKVFAMFKAGNGMSVHPTPAAHEEIAHAMELAYANKTTAADIFSADVSRATMALYRLVKEHGPEILEKVEAFAVQQGWVTAEELAAVEEQINAVAVAYQAKDNGAMLEACGKLAKTLYSYAEEKGIISDEKLAEYGDALLDFLKDYGADALKAIVKVAVDQNWLDEKYKEPLNELIDAADKAINDGDTGDLQEIAKNLAKELLKYAGDHADEIKDVVVPYVEKCADEIYALAKKYGPDAIDAIKKYAVEKKWIGEDTLAALDKEFKAIDKAAKDKDVKKLIAGCTELADTLYNYADTKELIPPEVKEAIAKIQQAAATVEKVVEMERKVLRGVTTVAVVGGVTYLGVSAVRHMVDKYQAAKEATAAKEAAAEAAVVQSAARINTVGGVQQWLNDNYDAGLTVDGGYGNMTKQAIVKALQKELGFTGADVDGVAGPKTLGALPELNSGSQGNTVVLLQCLLLGSGYGNDVEQAVLALQKAQGMAQTGVCDSEVWKILLG